MPTWPPALPLAGPEELVEEAVLIRTGSVIQEGLKTEQPERVRHWVPSPRGVGHTPSWCFWFAWRLRFSQRSDSWRGAAARRGTPLSTRM